MTCYICGEPDATFPAIMDNRPVTVHDECFAYQAEQYAKYPNVLAPIAERK